MSRSAEPGPAVPSSPAWRAVNITPVGLAAVASDPGEA
jgi:hypothetical protein